MSARRQDAWAIFGLAIGATAFLWPVVRGSACLAGGDLVNQYLPYRHVVNEALRAGDWPWWNPWTFCGTPLLANLNAALFYPPNLLSLWIPLSRWFGWTVWLHVIWGLAGTYLVQRRVGLSAVASALGAAVFWGSGFFIFNLWSGIVLFHQAGAWWPWAMLGALGWIQTGQPRWIVLAAVSLAMSFLAGAPQIAFYAAGTLALMSLVFIGGHPAWRQRLLGLGGVIALTALLVQIQFLPAREHTVASQRATWEGADAWELRTGDSLGPRSLLLALVPELCGDPTDAGTYWGTLQGFHEVVPAVMTPALLLIVLGFIAGERRAESGGVDRRRWTQFHLVLGLLALAVAFGRHSFLFWLLWETVPGFQEFRVPARLSLVALWCVACLTAVMFDHLWSAGAARRRWCISGWTVMGVGVLATAVFTFADTRSLLLTLGPPPTPSMLIPAGLTAADLLASHFNVHSDLIVTAQRALIAWGLVVALSGVGIAVLATWPRSWPLALIVLGAAFTQSLPPRQCLKTVPAAEFERTLYPRSEAVGVIQANLGAGRLLCFDSVYSHVNDQDQPELYPNRPLVQGIPDVRGYDPIITAAHARWVNVMAGLPPETPGRGFLSVGRVAHWDLARDLGVTVVAACEVINAPELEPLWASATGLRLWRLRGDHQPGRWVAGTTDADSAGATVTLLERGFDHAVWEIDAPSAGHFVTDVPFHPGWRARVDGEPAAVLEGETPWVTVSVPAGRHRVAMSFLPMSLVRGALFTLAGLLLAAGLCVARPRRSALGVAQRGLA